MNSKTKWLLGSFTLLVFIYLYLPIVLLIVFSFNEDRFALRWEGFTLQWYEQLFQNSNFLIGSLNSLLIAALTVVFSLILGVSGGYALSRYRFPGKKFIDALLYIPIVIPEVVLGIALLVLYTTLNFSLGIGTITLAHIGFTIPFVAIITKARLDSFDPSLEEAAMDLGANKFKAFIKITLPFLTPALISGGLLSFTLSIENFIITTFTNGTDKILPLQINSLLRSRITPEINAISSIWILAVVSAMFLVVIVRFLYVKSKNRSTES